MSVIAKEKQRGDLQITIDDKTYSVGHARISDNWLHLTVDGRGINAYVVKEPTGSTVMIRGLDRRIEDADDDRRHTPRKKGCNKGPTQVTPPMPAVVIRIMVAEGDTVEKGQGVVVVSAMKMETTLSAPYDGTVSALNVAEGDKVMPGDRLVDIDKKS